MATVAESVCCMEIPKTKEKVEAEESSIACITGHPGFDAVCLNVWVLQAAFFEYRHLYGSGAIHGTPINE